MESQAEGRFARIAAFLTSLLQGAWILFKTGLCFVLFSLPVLTVFASFGAMMHCVWQMQAEKEFAVFRLFWKAFRAEALRTSAVGFVCILVCAAAAVSGTYYYFLTAGSAVHTLSIVFFAVLFLYSIFFLLSFLCANAHISLPFGALLKNTAQYVFLALPANFGLLLVLLLLLVLFYIRPPLLLLSPLAAGGFCWLSIAAHREKIEKYMLNPPGE